MIECMAYSLTMLYDTMHGLHSYNAVLWNVWLTVLQCCMMECMAYSLTMLYDGMHGLHSYNAV